MQDNNNNPQVLSQTNRPWDLYGGNVLWVPVLALTGFGILFVYSASSVYSLQYYANEFYFAKKQAFFLLPAILAAILGALIPFEFYYRHILYIYFALVSMTFATHVPHLGRRIGGAARWLNVGPIPIQPAEFLKIFTLIFMVWLLHQTKKFKKEQMPMHSLFFWKQPEKWPFSVKCALLFFSPIAIIAQKDLGTTLVVVCSCLAILFLGGIAKRYFAALFGFLGFALVVAVVAEPYRISRVMTFLNPFKDPLGAGFQVIQSFVAVANGGLFGKGIGESQQKLFFLPEAHTDFILAVITEEMGFVGVLVLSLLYVVLYYAILRLVLCGRSSFDRLLAAGVLTMFSLTTLINMGVVAGALPTKGLPLPFISNGGSALIASYFLIGLMSQVSKRARNR